MEKTDFEFKSHQELGFQLKLFFFDEKSPGSAFFLPHGTILYNNLVNYIKTEYKTRGYSEVITPIMFDKSLWEQSGHYAKYKENMYVIQSDLSDKTDHANQNLSNQEYNDQECTQYCKQFLLKPMNCCGHCLIFKHTNLSYRDLPLRLADFGVLHRNEPHGSLRGLTRVRKFCQDDAHIFCTFEQVEQEIKQVLKFIHKVYGDFNMKIKFGLSTRPDQFIGDIDTWNKAEQILKSILKDYPGYEIYEKDGAFYGNKIDCKVTDAFGRDHQLATVQLDFNLPERFELEYKDSSGNDTRPVMIHRAIFGSVERFIGILLESTQGKLPFFVNPRQIAIIPTKSESELIDDYCTNLHTQLKKLNYNVDFICGHDTMQKKIANCEMLYYNYIVVIGKKEVESDVINLRNPKMVLNFDDFLKFLQNQNKN
jgi:threonyl-tRNA synthetase